MISEKFIREISIGKYLDPFAGFGEKESTFEIRHDAITGVTARILPFRFRLSERPDIHEFLEKSPPERCPFCPAHRDALTPRFTPDVSKSGQFRRGDAVLFPNAFPHDRYNAVALFSSRHFLALPELTAETMRNAFLVCRDYFARMRALDPELRFASINWNYMPAAGGGIVHPHLQTVMGAHPTRFVQTLYNSALRYGKETGRRLWEDLVAWEREVGQRYIASTGSVEWLVAFAPKGMAGEVDFYLPGRLSIFSLPEEELDELLAGLTRVFTYFDANNLISFNLSLFAALDADETFPLQGRIVPRFGILPLGTSDVNYFEKLHDEIICPVVPEESCADLRTFFQTGD